MGNQQLSLRFEDCLVFERFSTEQKDEVVHAVKEMMLAMLDKLANEGRDGNEE